MKTTLLTVFLLLSLTVTTAYAQIDGTLDPSFDPGVGPNAPVGNLVIQADGKVLLFYGFSKVNNIQRNEIARLNTDGTLDLTFNPGTGAQFGNVKAAVFQADGKIIIGGNYTNYDSKYTQILTRIHPNGSFDSTFRTIPGIGGEVLALALQPDGKVLVGGAFTGYAFKNSKNIVRLHPDGSFDSTFLVGTGANNGTGASNVNSILPLADGKIIIAGAFGNYNGTTTKRICRLYPNGSLDTTFSVGNGPNSDIASAVLQPDGKILIGGYFASVNFVPAPRLARLNSNGTLDTSFKAVINPYPFVCGVMCPQPDGKILVGTNSSFQRLNANGSKDSSFNQGLSPTAGVSGCRLSPDGRPVIVGGFTTYNGVARNYVARLKGPLGAGISSEIKPEETFIVYPNPASNVFNILLPAGEIPEIEMINLRGKVVRTILTDGQKTIRIERDGLPAGLYFLKAPSHVQKVMIVD